MFDAPNFALFDDNLADGGDVLLDELASVIRCERAEDVSACFAEIEAARRRGCWIALAARYELGLVFEERLKRHLPNTGEPLFTAWVFTRAQRLEAEATTAALAAHPGVAGVAGLRAAQSHATYCDAVERIRAYIDAGDCYQVNYTFPLEGELYGDPLALYAQLRASQPVRYGAFLRHAHGTILSRSPELFVERRGRRLTCRPMKGTAARESDPQELLDSEKNRAENLMIVDLIRNDLGRLAALGGVHVESLFDLEAYPSVWQLTSTVHAEPVDADLETVMRALFPCGSITGAPRIRAMEIIAELEAQPRGVYCGALGWIAPDGDFRFSVPIRTLEVDRENRVRCGIGSGIVIDSVASDEWAECRLKSRFMAACRAGFGLIETLRCESGAAEPMPLLERHLMRLSRSAAYFGFACDSDQIREALRAQAHALPVGVHRVRLELAQDGSYALTHAPLAPLPTGQRVRVSSRRVAAHDPLRRHKTTDRALYDAELARAVPDGVFDVLFFNEHDELCEGARSAVFVTNDEGELLTPPLECGLLDSVYRRLLLDEGRAREAVITRTQFARAREVWVANALRGLIEVSVEGWHSDQ